MAQLQNHRHELYAMHLAQGHPRLKAYVLAGYSAQHSHASAYRVAKLPDVVARVEELRTILTQNAQVLAARELQKEVVKEERAHIRNVESRVARQNETWAKLQRITEARAADALLSPVDVPGLETGLFTKVTKRVGSIVEERYELDTDLLTQINQVEDLTARELGQRAENQGTTSINIALLVPNTAAGSPAASVQEGMPRVIAGDADGSPAEAIIDITTTR
jgi:hypothetical protein